MVESSRITKQRQLIPFCKGVMKSHLSDIENKFFNIFYENCKKLRVNFFKDPLIRHLWTEFRLVCKQSFLNYLREVKQHTRGDLKLVKFLEDIRDLETFTNF